VISGFGEGLTLMSTGSIYRICVPAALGYGAVANGPIPASSDLVFQIELLDHRSKAEVEASRAAAADAARPKPAQ
jgi:FKBP-type peptidyl-prolyl cis-trans isomerase FkpA